jgi:uncharacterized protein YuzE
MKITYDKEADAAYIYLIEDKDVKPQWVKHTYSCDPDSVKGMINLDFDENDKLGGIEILDASKKLPSSLLDQAQS